MTRLVRRGGRRRRKSPRRPRFDYRSPGAYFVTVCSWRRAQVFGHVVNGRMVLNPLGETVRDCWRAIPDHFENVTLGEMVVMPNHVHGIVYIHPPGADEPTMHGVAEPGADGDRNRRGKPDRTPRVDPVGATHASPLRCDVPPPVSGAPFGDTPGAPFGDTSGAPFGDTSGAPFGGASFDAPLGGTSDAPSDPTSDAPSRPPSGAPVVRRPAVKRPAPFDDVPRSSNVPSSDTAPLFTSASDGPAAWWIATRGGRGPAAGSLGAVVGAFKAAAARRVNLARGTPGAPLWQRGYHDRIIRDGRALCCIARYIARNPMRWEFDHQNPMRRVPSE